MAEEPIRGVIDAIRAKLQAELDSHLGSLAQSHEQALQETRQRADSEAEQRWASKLDAVHTQWGSRLQSEVAAARGEVERALAEAVARARTEAEQAATAAAAQARRELEEAVATERSRVQADLERAHAERERAQADLQRAQADLERAHADRERAQADRQTAHEDLQRAHSERERTQQELQHAQSDRERTQQDLQRAQADHQRAQEELQRAQGERARSHEELQRAQSERERAQQDLQRAHETLERAQQELQRVQGEVETVREQSSRELEETRQRHAIDRASAANALEEARQAAASMPRDTSELLISMRAIDDATSLTEALSAAVRGAALESPRAALFIVNGAVLQEWPVDGVPPVHAGPIRVDGREAGFLTEVIRSGDTVALDGANGEAPMFSELSPGRRAIAVPFVLDGRPVAVLYADEGSDGQPLASWLETVQILGRHATSVITSLTAVRTAQAMGFIARRSAVANRSASAVVEPPPAVATEDEMQSARRYARLLVSEIKLYNEGAVRVGRERRDLRARLGDEIDRARRLYEQRIGTAVPDRETYFHQELVQTLADGDPSLFE
jgi:chemotaxis protein histidine kinase CheA